MPAHPLLRTPTRISFGVGESNRARILVTAFGVWRPHTRHGGQNSRLFGYEGEGSTGRRVFTRETAAFLARMTRFGFAWVAAAGPTVTAGGGVRSREGFEMGAARAGRDGVEKDRKRDEDVGGESNEWRANAIRGCESARHWAQPLVVLISLPSAVRESDMVEMK